MKTLLVISTYADADDVVERHYPFWEKSGCDILITSGKDSPAKRATLLVGDTGWAGPQSIERAFEIFRELVKLPYDAFCLGEYDCVTFRPVPDHPMDGVIYGPMWVNDDPSSYKATRFLHAFWWMQKSTIMRILEVADRLPFDVERSYGDRWFARLWEENNIPFANNPLNFSRQTISNDGGYEHAIAALDNGAWGVHGVKTEECLNRLAEAICS